MRTINCVDLDVYPPFEGFPKKGITFLRKLKNNNNRTWFVEHKAEYEDYVRLPMQSLIASLRVPMKKLAPEILFNPRRSLFRIYRDTRFSKNKTPYKSHVAAVFHTKGHWQESAGFYLQIGPDELYLGGGIYMPDSNQLKKIRQGVVEQADDFLSIVNTKAFKKRFGNLEGEKLRRAPQNYPIDHPMLDWLKYKQFYAGVVLDVGECYSKIFIKKVVGVYKDILPLVRFFNKSLGKI